MKLYRYALAAILSLAICLAAYGQTGPGTSPLSISKGGTSAITAALARAALGLAIGSNVQAWDSDLDCIAAISTGGLLSRTGAGTCSARTLGASTGLSWTNADGVSGAPSVALSINSLTEDSSPDLSNDFLLSYDTSASSHKKVKPSNLFSADTTKASSTRNITAGAGLTGGGDLSADRTLKVSRPVNPQTGTSYTVQTSDQAKLVTFSNSSPVAVGLPVASSPGANWEFDVANLGVGTVTITPTTSTINGAASLVLTTGQGAHIFSDGTNYFVQAGIGASGGGGSGTVTSVICGTGLTGGTITVSGTCAADVASQSDQETGTSNSKLVASGRQIYNPMHPKAVLKASILPTAVPGNISSVDTGTEQITWSTSHGLSTGDIILPDAGTWPTGVTLFSTYYVRAVSATIIKLYPTLANAQADTSAVDLTAAGSLTRTAKKLAITINFNSGFDSSFPLQVNVGGTTTVMEFRAVMSSTWTTLYAGNVSVAGGIWNVSQAWGAQRNLTTTDFWFRVLTASSTSGLSWQSLGTNDVVMGIILWGDLP